MVEMNQRKIEKYFWSDIMEKYLIIDKYEIGFEAGYLKCLRDLKLIKSRIQKG